MKTTLQADLDMQAIKMLPKTFKLWQKQKDAQQRGNFEAYVLKRINNHCPSLKESTEDMLRNLDIDIVDCLNYLASKEYGFLDITI